MIPIQTANAIVSIPFRADTGFELGSGEFGVASDHRFQSLSGLTLGLNGAPQSEDVGSGELFQSLSGLTLGLNWRCHTLLQT